MRTGDAAFLAGLVPDDQLHLLPYHRVVAGPLAAPAAELRDRLARWPGPIGRRPVRPPRGGPVSRWSGWTGAWYEVPPARLARASSTWRPPPGSLLDPLAGVADARTDPRLDFVPGGGADLSRLAELAAERHGLAVALHPPTVAQLVAEADAGRTMPPKSTWFEPKLRSGVFVVRRPPLSG